MKMLSALFALFILVPLVCFALSNMQSVDVALWPFSGAAQMPLYVLGLVPLLFGLIFGGFWGWLGSVPHRFKARRLTKERDALTDKIGDLQKTAIIQQADVEPKRPFWERKP